MKTNGFLSLLLFAGLLSACGPKSSKVMEEKSETMTKQQEAQKDQEVANEIPVAKPAFVAAGIKKTPCYGSCKVFEVHFDAKGFASYKGKSNVKMMGNWRAELSPEQCSAILSKAQELNYFAMANIYPANGKVIPDLPYTITYVEFGEEKKEIKNNHDAPQELLDFEAFLEDMIVQLPWKQTDGQ